MITNHRRNFLLFHQLSDLQSPLNLPTQRGCLQPELLSFPVTHRKIRSIPLNKIRQFIQKPPPFGGVHGAPHRPETESLVGSIDRQVYVFLGALLHLSQGLAGRGVDRLEGLATLGLAPFVVDEDLQGTRIVLVAMGVLRHLDWLAPLIQFNYCVP